MLADVPAEVLRARIEARENHFMPASLVDSQLATLEPPEPDERALILDGNEPAETLAEQVLAFLQR